MTTSTKTSPHDRWIQDDSLRRAAVLVSCLDEADARRLLELLGPEPAGRIRTAMTVLGPVTFNEREGVIRQFLEEQPDSSDRGAGVELDADLARRLAGAAEQVAPSTPPAGRSERSQTPFAFLLETDAEVIAPFLAQESPQTVAVVLSFLGRRQAAEILRRLDPGFQRQVLTRLASLEDIDPTCIDVVAAELRTWIDRQRSVSRSLKRDEPRARETPAPHPRSERDALIAALQHAASTSEAPSPDPFPRDDGRTASRPKEPVRSAPPFEDLIRLSDQDLLQVFRASPREILALALAGADEALIDRVTGSLPRREAKRIQRSIQLQGPTRLNDIEAAQQQIANIALEVLDRDPKQ